MRNILFGGFCLFFLFGGAWALKGKALLITGVTYHRPGNLVLVTLNGPVKTSRIIVADGNCLGPCFSPDGTKIAYANMNGNIYTINLDGTGVTPITTCIPETPGDDHCPSLSWTVNNEIFWSQGTYQLLKVNVATHVKSVAHTLSDINSQLWVASVSRDGTRCGSRVQPINHIYSILIGGAEFSNGHGCQGSISPDGQWVTSANETHTTATIKNFGQPTVVTTMVCPAPQRYMSNLRFSRFSANHVCITADYDHPYVYDLRDNSTVSLGTLRGQCWDYYPDPDPTPPSDVNGLGAVPAATGITLAWNAATDAESGIAGYVIFRGLSPNPTQILASVGNITAFSDLTGLDGRTYYYRIKAKNEIGSVSVNFSNQASAIMPTGQPYTLVISNTSATSGRVYVWDTLAVGKLAHPDQNWFFSKIPARYEGYSYLKTPSTDNTAGSGFSISFNVSEPVTVYIAWDDRAPPPGFTSMWDLPKTARGMIIDKWVDSSYHFQGDYLMIDSSGTEHSFSLWAKNFLAGTIETGKATPQYGGPIQMYSVIVTPQGAVTAAEVRPLARASLQVSPNPFRAGTSVGFTVPSRQKMSLHIHDCAGRLVQILVQGEMAPGSYRIPWTGAGQPSGLYIARLKTRAGVLTQKIYLIR